MSNYSVPAPSGCGPVALVRRRSDAAYSDWELTDDLNALNLPDDEMIVATDADEAKGALQARFAVEQAGLSRVAQVANMTGGSNPNFRVYSQPRADDEIASPSHGVRSDALQILEGLIRANGPVCISATYEYKIRNRGGYDSCDLVLSPHGDIVVARLDPKAANRRRYGRTRTTRKYRKEQAEMAAICTVADAIGRAYEALYEDLNAAGFGKIVVHGVSTWVAKDRTLASWFNTGFPAIVELHQKVIGKNAYRRLQEMLNLRGIWRDRSPKYDWAKWLNFTKPLLDWLDAEAAAKEPRPVKPKPQPATAEA